MKIVGFSYKKISVEKNKDIDQPVKVNTNINIREIKKSGLDVFKEGDIFDFEYEFKIDYGPEPNFATVLFIGNILILIEDGDLAKKILKEWKSKLVPENVRIPLMNVVFAKCNLKAMQLEEDLGLPFHIPPPQLVKQEDEESKK